MAKEYITVDIFNHPSISPFKFHFGPVISSTIIMSTISTTATNLVKPSTPKKLVVPTPRGGFLTAPGNTTTQYQQPIFKPNPSALMLQQDRRTFMTMDHVAGSANLPHRPGQLHRRNETMSSLLASAPRTSL